jgi:hypothetical protein
MVLMFRLIAAILYYNITKDNKIQYIIFITVSRVTAHQKTWRTNNVPKGGCHAELFGRLNSLLGEGRDGLCNGREGFIHDVGRINPSLHPPVGRESHRPTLKI